MPHVTMHAHVGVSKFARHLPPKETMRLTRIADRIWYTKPIVNFPAHSGLIALVTHAARHVDLHRVHVIQVGPNKLLS